MMLKTSNKTTIWFFIAGILLIYVFLRSYHLSITHDEVGTLLNYGQIDVWTCFWNEACWKNANNHLLNTALLQATIGIFGISEWSLRLPNVLMFALYLFFSIRLLQKSRAHPLLQWLGFALLALNPYLLEFFGLARGYGMSVAFMMAALFYVSLYLKSYALQDVLMVAISMILAILSNFTMLIVWVAIWAAIFIIQMSQYFWKELSLKKLLHLQLIPIISSAILGLALFRPIAILKQKGEFNWGANHFMDMFSHLTSKEMYGEKYLGTPTDKIYFIISAILIIGCVSLIVFNFIRKKDSQNFPFFIALIFLLICIGQWMQVNLLGDRYLLGRKSILFIPICSLLVFYAFSYLKHLKSKHWIYIPAMVAFMATYHFFRTVNLSFSKEWEYDQNSKAVVERIIEDLDSDDSKPTVGVHWLFYPATEFYRRFKHPAFSLGPYQKDPDVEGDYTYFYMYKDQLHLVPDKYELLEQYNTGNLYKLKGQ